MNRMLVSAALAAVVSLVGCTQSMGSENLANRQSLVSDTPQYGRPAHKVVALTFDDGPSASTLDVAKFLNSRGISATFFFMGCRFAGPTQGVQSACTDGITYPESLIDQVTALGHRVGNHTQDHLDLAGQTSQTVIAQLTATQQILNRHTHDGIFLFRAPANQWSVAAANAARSSASLNRLAGPIAWSQDRYCENSQSSAISCAIDYYDSFKDSTDGVVLLMHEIYAAPDRLALVKALVHILEANGYSFSELASIPGFVSSAHYESATWSAGGFSDTAGYGANPGYWETIRFADVNGDGRADVCGKLSDGFYCALSNGSGFGSKTLWTSGGALSDSAGWLPEQYSTTIQLGDVNGDGKADLCARGVASVYCATANSAGTGFESWSSWSTYPAFSDAEGLGGAAGYYRSFRLADVNGDGRADACVRTASGIKCALSSGTTFTGYSVWIGTEFADPAWLPVQYGGTLSFADLNGDSKADVCGRSAAGIVCATSTGSSFVNPTYWSAGNDFTDSAGWATLSSYYLTVKLADINGDGVPDLCGRGGDNVYCGLGGNLAFAFGSAMVGDFADVHGWDIAKYGDSFSLADVDGDGRREMCARGSTGIACSFISEVCHSN